MTGQTTPKWGTPRPPLVRARPGAADMPTPWVAGVCSGVSVHLGVPVSWVRAAFVVLSFAGGVGVFLYVWLWLTVKRDATVRKVGAAPPQARPPSSIKSATGGQLMLAGLLFLIVAIVLLNVPGLWSFENATALFSVLAIVVGMVTVWTQSQHISEWRTPKVLALIGVGIALIVGGAVFLVARNDPPGVILRGALVGVVVLLGLTAALAPIWLGLVNNLSVAKANEARETERADIAAHLHDSVLQTLTLIRASAEDPSRVRSLALSQERQLRSWLYTGSADPGESAAEALRTQVADIETTYGVEVDVVCVGDTRPGPAEQAAIAAAAEAVTNAIKHGAPPISVYMEAGTVGFDVFVKDAGEGFVVSEIPDDRHGVNHSIVGRVERVGGTVSIRTRRPDFRGTEIRIRVPITENGPGSNARNGAANGAGDKATTKPGKEDR